MADNSPNIPRTRSRTPRGSTSRRGQRQRRGRGRGRGRSAPERINETSTVVPPLPDPSVNNPSNSKQSTRSKLSTDHKSTLDNESRSIKSTQTGHKSKERSKVIDLPHTKKVPKVVTVLNDDDTSSKRSRFSFRYKEDDKLESETSNHSEKSKSDRHYSGQQRHKQNANKTFHRTGNFGRGGNNKSSHNIPKPEDKIRHMYYYFDIPWDEQTKIVFREIGIDDDYKLIDFTGWSVTDMYTILQGTDSLKLLRSSTSTNHHIEFKIGTTIPY